MKKITLSVKGMHCRSCEMLIKDSLGELEGIAIVNADHKKGTVDVSFDDAKVTVNAIRDAIKKEGYEEV